MSLKDFGSRVKSARLEKGLSQRSLGLSIGLSDKTISAYESSRSYPTLDVLQKIAEVLSKDMSFFVTNDDREQDIETQIEKVLSLQKELDQKLETLQELLSKEE